MKTQRTIIEPQSRPDCRDTIATNLRLTCDALRQFSGWLMTWARPPRVACVTRPTFARDKIFKIDLQPIYDRAEWHTRPSTDLRPTFDQRRIQLWCGSLVSEINKFHDRILRLKAVVELVDLFFIVSQFHVLRVFGVNLALGTNFPDMLIEIHTFSLKNAWENVVWEMAVIWPQSVGVEPCPSVLMFRHLWIKSLDNFPDLLICKQTRTTRRRMIIVNAYGVYYVSHSSV